jgi:hypothetical protein
MASRTSKTPSKTSAVSALRGRRPKRPREFPNNADAPLTEVGAVERTRSTAPRLYGDVKTARPSITLDMSRIDFEISNGSAKRRALYRAPHPPLSNH